MKIRGVFKRVSALLLCLVLLTGALCACNENKAVYVYNGIQIDESIYRYWLSYYKSYFITRYGGTDSEDFFQKRMSGAKTYGDSMLEQAQASMKTNLVCLSLFEQYALSLTDEETKAVDSTLSSRVSDFGSKETMNSYLSKIGMDYDKLREVLLLEAKVSKLTSYLYGDTTVGTAGAVKITDDEVSQFYQKHYTAFKLILIRTDGKNVLDENGEATKDENGELITEPFTDAELAEKEATVKEIEQRLDAGDSFDELQSLFNQDADSATYPEGYLVSDFYSVFSEDVTNAVKKLAVDAHTTVKDDIGYEILMRVGLPSAPYNDDLYTNMMNGFRDYLNSTNFSANTADAIGEVRANDSVIEKYDIKSADISFFTFAGTNADDAG